MTDLPVTVYTPESSLRHPMRMLSEMFEDLILSRELAWRLAVRDISAQYRQTALGFLWAIILPLSNTLVWLFLNRSGIVTVSPTGVPYAVHVFTGTMLWAVFMDAVNAPLQLTIAAKAMLVKINFPREALVLSGIYQTLFNASIKLALMLPVVILMGVAVKSRLAFFPLSVMSLVLAGTTLGLLVTPLGMLYTDIGKSLPLLLQFLMYLSPVVFPMPNKGLASVIMAMNPITPLILTARAWLIGQPSIVFGYFLVVNALTLATLLLVWIVYRLAMPILIERISA